MRIQWGFFNGSTSGGKALIEFSLIYASKNSYFIFIQDADGHNPRNNTTQQDTGGYQEVTGVDRQEASCFYVSTTSLRTFYWFTIGY